MDSEQIELYGEEFIRRTARSEKGLRNSARPAGKTAAGTQEYTGNTTRNRIQQKTEQDRTENGADDLSEENRHSENQHFTWFTSQGIITGPACSSNPARKRQSGAAREIPQKPAAKLLSKFTRISARARSAQ